MIVGMDIDDTISRHPDFFSLLSRALVASGHSVIIITVRQGRADTERQLRDWGIAYDTLITFPSEQAPLDLIAWKARMCADSSIEILFEDSVEVVQRMDHGRTLCMIPIDPRFHDLAQMICRGSL